MKLLLLTISLWSLMCSPLLAQEAKVTPLMSEVLTDISGKEGLMITVDYAPGGSSPIHRHNAHAFVYVLEGSIVMPGLSEHGGPSGCPPPLPPPALEYPSSAPVQCLLPS